MRFFEIYYLFLLRINWIWFSPPCNPPFCSIPSMNLLPPPSPTWTKPAPPEPNPLPDEPQLNQGGLVQVGRGRKLHQRVLQINWVLSFSLLLQVLNSYWLFVNQFFRCFRMKGASQIWVNWRINDNCRFSWSKILSMQSIPMSRSDIKMWTKNEYKSIFPRKNNVLLFRLLIRK